MHLRLSFVIIYLIKSASLYAGNSISDTSLTNYSIGGFIGLVFFDYKFNPNHELSTLDHKYEKKSINYTYGIDFSFRGKRNGGGALLAISDKGVVRNTNPAYYSSEWQISRLDFTHYFIDFNPYFSRNLFSKRNISFDIRFGLFSSIPFSRKLNISYATDNPQIILKGLEWNWDENDLSGYQYWKFIEPTNKMNGGISISLPVSYSLKRISFSTVASFQHYLINVYSSLLVKRPNSVSILFKISYLL
jgi:hypothetical protein